MVAEKFQIYGVKITDKKKKKKNLFIFTYAPKQNSPTGSYYYPLGRTKLSTSSEQSFLKIFFFFLRQLNSLLLFCFEG